MRLVLLRHGQTAWNAVNRYQGQTDIPLDDVGRAQAAEAAARWAGRRFDLALSSPLVRARHTAEAVMAGRDQPLLLDDDFRETHGGTWEGLTFTEIAAQWPEEFAAWRSSHPEHGPLGGEMPGQSGARVIAALGRLVAAAADHGDPETVFLTAHGGCLRAATALMTGLGAEQYPRLERLRNGAAIVLDGSPGRPGQWTVHGYNV